MRARGTTASGAAASTTPAERWSQPSTATHAGRWATDPGDVAETALLTKIPALEPDDEPDGPVRVAERRSRGAAPKPKVTLRSRLEALRSLWPLLPILVVQGTFAWRLLVTNTAFLDEATYLWSGRVVADHFLHGTGMPEFQTFFSGAPVLYPVLAAVASKLGGLTAARLLSLAFMLLATTAVYLTGRRMFGALTGFFAAGLFAALGPTIHLSSFATFDAMSLSMLAWSTYFVVRFAHGESRNALLYGAVLMVLADCTKYASLLWNPVIILLAASTGPGFAAWRCSRSWNLQRFAMVSTTLLALAVVIGRKSYFTGFDSTTLQRAAANSTAASIISHVSVWIGVMLALGLLGVLVGLWRVRRGSLSKHEAATLAVLLAAGLLAPANQLRIHTLLSLDKHVAFGASFAAIPAGYLLARLVRVLGGNRRTNRVRYAFCTALVAVAALIPLNVAGVRVATGLHNAWPDSSKLVSALKPLVHKGNDNYLVEDYYVPAYYLPSINYRQWHDTYSASWYDASSHTTLTGVPAFQAAILAHDYKVIVIDYADTMAVDDAITGTIIKAKYREADKISVTYGSSKITYNIWVAP
jgi:hypothetical protein